MDHANLGVLVERSAPGAGRFIAGTRAVPGVCGRLAVLVAGHSGARMPQPRTQC